MSANTNALKAALATEVAAITDAVAKAEATVLLDRYIAAVDSQSELESGGLQQYTIAGRSITRRNVGEGEAAISRLKSELYRYIYGPVSYIGMGGLA